MLLKLFISLVIVVASLCGILVSTNYLPRDLIVHLVAYRDFFDVALPILAFGALVKYLCTFREKK